MNLKWENFDSIFNRDGEYDLIARTPIGFYQIHIGISGAGHWWSSLMDADELGYLPCDDVEHGKSMCQDHWDNLLGQIYESH